MKFTSQDAQAAVARMFPGFDAYVADGCETHESGVVKDRQGNTVASFRLIYEKEWEPENADMVVTEIRVGQVGQFCGTIDQIEQYERQHKLQT